MQRGGRIGLFAVRGEMHCRIAGGAAAIARWRTRWRSGTCLSPSQGRQINGSTCSLPRTPISGRRRSVFLYVWGTGIKIGGCASVAGANQRPVDACVRRRECRYSSRLHGLVQQLLVAHVSDCRIKNSRGKVVGGFVAYFVCLSGADGDRHGRAWGSGKV
jgi:hypothetical protein